MRLTFQKLFLLWVAISARALAAEETPLSFSLDGSLYDSPAGTRPLLDPAARVRVQILPPSGSCVLYDEEQTVNTAASEGNFSIQVGTSVGAPRRVAGSDSGNAMTAVFQNRSSIVGSAGACNYSPLAGDTRRLRIIVTPTNGTPDTLSPDMLMSSVPSALVAETLQGTPRSGFLQLGAGSLSQANVEDVFSSANYPTLTSLLAGNGVSSSAGYAINAGTGGSGGIDFNVNGSTKAAIANNGNFTVDSGSFFVDASAHRVGIGTTAPAASLDLGAKTDAVILPSGTTAQRPSPATAGMVRFNATTAKLEFHDGLAWTNLGADISGITAGGDLSGTFPNPGVMKIRGQEISAAASSDGQVMRFDGTNYTPAFVAMADLRSRTTGAAALTSSCTSAQTLTWNSATDTLACTAIGGLDAGVITGGTVAAARLPASAIAWNSITGGINFAGGKVGVGTTAPNSLLDVQGGAISSGAQGTSAGQGGEHRFYELTANGTDYVGFRAPDSIAAPKVWTLPSTDGTNGQVLKTDGAGNLGWASAGGGSGALSSLQAASAVNTIDNLNFAQTWNWSTAASETPLTVAANALTTGSLLTLSTSNNGLNSNSGLLNVANTGTSVNGTVARIQSNSTAGSGLTVLASGRVGIGSASPGTTLDVNGGIRPGAATVVTTTCSATIEGTQRYNYTSHFMEYCNGTAWVQLTAQAVGSVTPVSASGPPVNASTYAFSSASGNFTPNFGSVANTWNGNWLAVGTSAVSNTNCVELQTNSTARIIYDLGTARSIAKVYLSSNGPPYGFMIPQVAFSSDGVTFSSSATISMGNQQSVQFTAATLGTAVTARYVRVTNGGSSVNNASNQPNMTFCQIAVGP